jgi:hypothetical protein
LAEDTTGHCGAYGYKITGQVANFPAGHPPLLIERIHLSKIMS